MLIIWEYENCFFIIVILGRKPAFLNVQIKLNSKVKPNFSVSVFKGFLCTAYKICSKPYINEENKMSIDAFTNAGYEKQSSEIISDRLFKHIVRPNY